MILITIVKNFVNILSEVENEPSLKLIYHLVKQITSTAMMIIYLANN